MKKRLISGLVALAAVGFGIRVFAASVQAGRDLVPPTAYCHIVEDPNGNLYLQDASTGPIKLSDITNPTIGFSIPSGNLNINSGSQYFGSATAAPSTATATSPGATGYTGFLSSGTLQVAAVQGSVLIATTTQNNVVTVAVNPATGGNTVTNCVGIAGAAASTGTVVSVITNGWVLALTTGTVNPGDVLVSTQASAGYLAANNSASANQEIGIALQAGNAAGGLIKIKLK